MFGTHKPVTSCIYTGQEPGAVNCTNRRLHVTPCHPQRQGSEHWYLRLISGVKGLYCICCASTNKYCTRLPEKKIWRRTGMCLQQMHRVAYTSIATWRPCSLARSGIGWLPSALSLWYTTGQFASICERTSDMNIICSSATASDMEGLAINSM